MITHYYADHKGGVEVVASRIADGVVRSDVRFTWAASGPPPDRPNGEIDYLPMRSWNLVERWLGVAFPIWMPWSLARLARSVIACDLVHLHEAQYLGHLLAFVLAKILGRPVVITQHNGRVPHAAGLSRSRMRMIRAIDSLYRVFNGLVLPRCNQAVFTNDVLLEYFTRFISFNRPPLTIPNGFDRSSFRPASDHERREAKARLGLSGEALNVLFVGRFVERKGLPILKELAAEFRSCRWVFVGWGNIDPRDWELANVRHVGPVGHDDLANYYQSADLLIVPSLIEGGCPPLVVQEAMACGTPVLLPKTLAAACPGIGQAAYESELDSAEIAGVLTTLLQRPEALAERRLVAAAYSEIFADWAQVSTQYRTLYTRLIEQARCRRVWGHPE